MVEYVDINVVSEKKSLKLPRGIYIIWFFGFAFCFSLTIAIISFFYGHWFIAALMFMNSIFFLPPKTPNHYYKIIKYYKKIK